MGVVPNDFIAGCLRSWESLSPYGFNIRIWDRQSILLFIDQHYEFALPAFKNARNLAEAGDIARYLIIYHYGGYYADWDIQLNRPAEFMALHEECPTGQLLLDPSNGTLASEYFAAMEKERFLLELTKDIVETYVRGERELMYTPQYSGPFRMKVALRRHPVTSQQLLAVKDVFEFDYAEIRSAKQFGEHGIMTHFWSHTWMQVATVT